MPCAVRGCVFRRMKPPKPWRRWLWWGMKGVRGGIAAIDALRDVGFNTKSDEDLTTNENGVRGADGAIMQDVWVKIHDIDAPLFEDEEALAALEPSTDDDTDAKAQTGTKDPPAKEKGGGAKTDTGNGGGKKANPPKEPAKT